MEFIVEEIGKHIWVLTSSASFCCLRLDLYLTKLTVMEVSPIKVGPKLFQVQVLKPFCCGFFVFSRFWLKTWLWCWNQQREGRIAITGDWYIFCKDICRFGALSQWLVSQSLGNVRQHYHSRCSCNFRRSEMRFCPFKGPFSIKKWSMSESCFMKRIR